MPKHSNLVANGQPYAYYLSNYFNSLPDDDKKTDFLCGMALAYSDYRDVAFSDEENNVIDSLLNAYRAPVKMTIDGKNIYDLEAAERNARALIRKQFKANLALGRKMRQNMNALPVNTQDKETIAAFQARNSVEMIDADAYNVLFQMVRDKNTEASEQLKEATGKDWANNFEIWLSEEVNSFESSLNPNDLVDFRNGSNLLGDDPQLLKGKKPEDVGLNKDNLSKIREDSKYERFDKYLDFSYRNKELYEALDKFNSKRFWGIGSWWSSDPSVGRETTEHKKLKDSARNLIEATNLYEKYRYLPNVNAETKLAIAESIRHYALDVQQNEIQYESSKTSAASSPAGIDRMAGARALKNQAINITKAIEQDIKAYSDEIKASKSASKEEIKTDASVKETTPVRPVRQFEVQRTGQVEIIGGSEEKEDTNKDVFARSIVTIKPEMRALMLEFAGFAQDWINNRENMQRIEALEPPALRDSLTRAASMKGTENLQEFKEICDNLAEASKSYAGQNEVDTFYVNSVESFKTDCFKQINKAYFRKHNLTNKGQEAITKTINDYKKVLSAVQNTIAADDNSQELKALETAVQKITEDSKKFSRNELITLGQDVTTLAANLTIDPKYDSIVKKCTNAENRMNKRFSKQNLAEIKFKENNIQAQKKIDEYVSQVKPKLVIESQKGPSVTRTTKAKNSQINQKDALSKSAIINRH